jgi:hypothetical protein
MILFDDVVQVLARAHFDVPPARVLTSQKPQRTTTRDMSVERHFARHAWSVRRERLAEERLCGRNSSIAAKQEVDGLALLVDGAIKGVPFREWSIPGAELFEIGCQ